MKTTFTYLLVLLLTDYLCSILAYVKHNGGVSRSSLTPLFARGIADLKNLWLQNSEGNAENIESRYSVLRKMFLISGPLGMSLDNYHGLFGVLEYESIGRPIQVVLNDTILLKSAVWVPALFAFAGLGMSAIIITLDVVNGNKKHGLPSWPTTLYSISLFSFQYYLSGLLDFLNVDLSTTHLMLMLLAISGYSAFDKSLSGLQLSIMTAIAGPVVEIFLINYGHLYSYTNADTLGICSWIPWVYFLGGTAVGNLARRLYHDENKDIMKI